MVVWFWPRRSGGGSDALMMQSYHNKEQEILACLQGTNNNNDNTISLWHLRQLALSPGGLLDPSLRKRAWPILTGCHEDVAAAHTRRPIQRPAVVSSSDRQAVRRDVKHTVWDIAEHFAPQQDGSLPDRSSIRRVCFSLDETVEEDDDDPLPAIVPSHTADSDTGGGAPHNDSTHNSSFTSSCRRRTRWRKASRHEQKIVANVVTNVLRTGRRYFSGLHNLTALLLLNLESPSLTSLLLCVLCVCAMCVYDI